jgi:hypothetical protein
LFKRENEIKEKGILLEKREAGLKERENKLINKHDTVDNNKLMPTTGFQIYVDPVNKISNDHNNHGIQKAKELLNNKNVGVKYSNSNNTKILKRAITHDVNDKGKYILF